MLYCDVVMQFSDNEQMLIDLLIYLHAQITLANTNLQDLNIYLRPVGCAQQAYTQRLSITLCRVQCCRHSSWRRATSCSTRAQGTVTAEMRITSLASPSCLVPYPNTSPTSANELAISSTLEVDEEKVIYLIFSKTHHLNCYLSDCYFFYCQQFKPGVALLGSYHRLID